MKTEDVIYTKGNSSLKETDYNQPQVILYPDFEFTKVKVEVCPTCGKPYDENHVVPNPNFEVPISTA